MWKGTLSVTKPCYGGVRRVVHAGRRVVVRRPGLRRRLGEGRGLPDGRPHREGPEERRRAHQRVGGLRHRRDPAGREVRHPLHVPAGLLRGERPGLRRRARSCGIGWKYLGARCVPGPAGTNTFRMEVRVRMIARQRRHRRSSRGRGRRALDGRRPSRDHHARLPVHAPVARAVAGAGWSSTTGTSTDFTIVTDNVSAGADVAAAPRGTNGRSRPARHHAGGPGGAAGRLLRDELRTHPAGYCPRGLWSRRWRRRVSARALTGRRSLGPGRAR